MKESIKSFNKQIFVVYLLDAELVDQFK